jgi:hypothetical protein
MTAPDGAAAPSAGRAGDHGSTVLAGLSEAAAAFGGNGDGPVELVHAPLVWKIDRGQDESLALAIELVYEGYLLHYRTSRLMPSSTPNERRLLAGDYFYAHGLSLIAGGTDVGRVGLLTRLMAACAYLRAENVEFAVDDRLWELVVRGVAAGGRSRLRRAAVRGTDLFDEAIRAGRPAALAAVAEAALAEVRAAGKAGS